MSQQKRRREQRRAKQGREAGEPIELYPQGGLMTVTNLVIKYQGATWRRYSHRRVKCIWIS